jgi:hypothetical protein
MSYLVRFPHCVQLARSYLTTAPRDEIPSTHSYTSLVREIGSHIPSVYSALMSSLL